jgi:hypothetical protein
MTPSKDPQNAHEAELLRAKYLLFDKFALKDQRSYYGAKIDRNRRAASEVNFLRALCALLTIVVTALTTYFVQTDYLSTCVTASGETLTTDCSVRNIINVLLFLSVVFPSLGAFFNMLADLFQWDRLVQIYREAKDGLNGPDAYLSDREDPAKIGKEEYRARLLAYAIGTLGVMRDETGQWGQLIRPPEDIEKFRAQAEAYYRDLEEKTLGKDAPGRTKPADSPPSPPVNG